MTERYVRESFEYVRRLGGHIVAWAGYYGVSPDAVAEELNDRYADMFAQAREAATDAAHPAAGKSLVLRWPDAPAV